MIEIEFKNIKINKKENCIFVYINPKIYSIDVIYSAAYVFLDRAYMLLNGDSKKQIIVELKPKEKYDLKKLSGEFYNELLNYAFYKEQTKKTYEIRKAILQRALITSELSTEIQPVAQQIQEIPEFKATEADWIEDPEEIAVLWEEKYGKKAKKINVKKK